MGTHRRLTPPTTDIKNPEDVDEMVRRFYSDVAQDELLGPIFNHVAAVDWSEHVPKLASFWNRALFGLEGYAGNPFREHLKIHQLESFQPRHFERWLDLFSEIVDLGWVGPNADRVKALALNVARVHARRLTGATVDYPQLAVTA